MTLTPDQAQKARALAGTNEKLLPGFSPLERAFILTLKEYLGDSLCGGCEVPLSAEYAVSDVGRPDEWPECQACRRAVQAAKRGLK